MINYISCLPQKSETVRKTVILGSTGSIGVSTLGVIDGHKDKFQILALAGARNAHLLARQALQWRPSFLAVLDESVKSVLVELLPADYKPEILVGPAGYAELASLSAADLIVAAQVGAAGLAPAMAAAKAGKIIALANKEALVLAGDLFRKTCLQTGACILPVDSEHNALFQCLAGHDHADVRRLILTASGGPFRNKTSEQLENVTCEQALRHPNWSMGKKISIDSATLMNKGLEVIEAHHLFGLPADKIEVVVHPQSVIHSLAEYEDMSMLAHLGPPDMAIAIAYCLAYPQRIRSGLEPLDLIKVARLDFSEPDWQNFPCLTYAFESLKAGPDYQIVLNAANEVAVQSFLDKKTGFMDIARLIDKALNAHQKTQVTSPESIMELDARTRNIVQTWIK